jgi:hypothetical protein
MSKPLVLTAMFVLVIVSSVAQTRTQPSAKSSPAEESNISLRMDLLQLPQKEMTPPQRNIFAPRRNASGMADIVPQGGQCPVTDRLDRNTSVLPGEPIATPPVMTVNLRYIGFIESSRRMIALVVFEGQAVAVVEGEVVGEGVRIGKITREQVEAILPDSSTRAFSLEGE